jgi:GTP-sensing pleiotropic transcriptional regulator CodY
MLELPVDKKEKKTCFFEWIIELHTKANDYFIRLPKHQWIPFKSIPGDIFTLVFNIIDRSSNIAVDRDYTEFLIMDKRKFPDNARE